MRGFNDPGFPAQWQLGAGTGINAAPLYDEYTGAGIRIGVVDTGLNYANPDFAGQVDLRNDYDALGADDNANNVGGDQHGTEVGLILAAAADNGYGRVGAAFGATLVAYRFDTRGARTIAQETALLQLQSAVDISHNSWSRSGEVFRDNFNRAEYAAAAAAIAHAAAEGRGGLGTVIVRSAGNDGFAGDDVNTHNYSNNRYSILVGATAWDGSVQGFSNPGAALTVVAPGEATSWAAPLVSATAALMLQANPGLGYRDVMTILSLTAKVTDPAGAGWHTNGGVGWNGGGLHVSRGAGFGLIDALAAVRLAETWAAQSTAANLLQEQATGAGAANIPDSGAMSRTVQIVSNLQVERAEVEVDIAHEKISDLRLVLVSPKGTESVLLDRLGNGAYDAIDGRLAFTLASTHFLWEDASGAWTLRVEDLATGNAGTLQGWSLRLYGSRLSDDGIYVYTNEFASVHGMDAARRVLSDPSGNDTLNASAVSAASVIDLNEGATSRIAGASLAKAAGTQIENAITGDGADMLVGNPAANRLSGMRGDDTLQGGAGDDTLLGGAGTDLAVFSGNRADYSVAQRSDGSLIIADTRSGGDGTDTLRDLELFRFADRTAGLADLVAVDASIPDQLVLEDTPWSFRIPSGAFSQNDGDLTFAATLSDGSTLPAWLTFTAAIQTFQGLPPSNFNGSLELKVTARTGSLNASDTFTLTVTPANDPPAAIGLSGNTIAEGSMAGTPVGTLAGWDVEGDHPFSFDLIDDAGGRLAIHGDQLVVKNGILLDYEQASTHRVTVRATDAGGAALDIAFLLSITDVLAETMFGTAGRDRLMGGPGRDRFDGLSGKDLLSGGGGHDRLDGGTGHDTLFGGLGNDLLYGRSGKDAFVFDTRPNARTNLDRIVDFSVRDDTIWLDNAVFRKLGRPGWLREEFFAIGPTAKNKNDYVLYDAKKGVLSYDVDGSGTKAAVALATLKKGLKMTAADFFVI